MTFFAPIAIVGQACLLPGSLSPESLWNNVLSGRDLMTEASFERWRADPARVMGRPGWNHRAGYVAGFDEIFDPEGFAIDKDIVTSSDPLVQWLLHCGREALSKTRGTKDARIGAVIGNLSLPTEGMARWAESHWLDDDPSASRALAEGRFMSGRPAKMLARALGLEAGAFCLDAACASSLYAIALASRMLHVKQADIMLAGAVNRADQLFLHIGFQALQALSPTGQSRPFHRGADGLIPSEGAAFVALKRLDDALDAGDEILGVIRGVGLSNDGRSRGLLVPESEGQIRSIEQAWQMSGLDPKDVSLIECHATGTALGDSAEVRSLSSVFADSEGAVPIGSIKSNMGHPITVAGLAGLIKILGAMEAGTRPPTLYADDPIDALEGSPLRLLTRSEPWNEPHRIAALSAFGFGGNNSHLIVEAFDSKTTQGTGFAPSLPAPTTSPTPTGPIAVTGFALRAGVLRELEPFLDALADDRPIAAGESVEIHLEGLRFPPRDLGQSLAQQLLILDAATEAVERAGALPRDRTSVVIGMECDPHIVRHGLRARLADLPQARDKSAAWIKDLQNQLADPLTAAHVIGCLPNIVANRINAQLDLAGPSFSISSDENSGLDALRFALGALRSRDIDAALVGAVDLSADSLHEAALNKKGGDAAICFVLKRLDDARDAGDDILAIIDGDPRDDESASLLPRIAGTLGHSHAASGLLAYASRLFEGAPPKVYVEEIRGRKVSLVAANPRELAIKRSRALHAIEHGASPGEGVYLDAPIKGEIAMTFTGAAAAYQGMGRPLMHAFPGLVDDFRRRFSNFTEATRWMLGADPNARPTPLDKLFASSVLSQLHADLTTKVLGIDYDAAIGFSSGETNALFAAGVWSDFDGLFEDFAASGAFDVELGGECRLLKEVWKDHDLETVRWESWRLLIDRDELDNALVDEPLVHLTLINAPGDYTIGGESAAVHRVLDRVGRELASYLEYDIAVHCQELEGFSDAWTTIHTRTTKAVPGTRIYSHSTGTHYTPDATTVADALLGQALHTVDFPRLIENAYADGVRIFIEHGPQSTLKHWIRRILGERPHLAVSLDSKTESSLRPTANAIAQLVAAGVDLDWQAFNRAIDGISCGSVNSYGDVAEAHRTLQFPLHPDPIMLPSDEPQWMEPAPDLPPVLAYMFPMIQLSAPPVQHSPEVATLPAPTRPTLSKPAHPATTPSALDETAALLSAVHKQYLAAVARQRHLHESFLESSHRALLATHGGPLPGPPKTDPVRPSEDRTEPQKTGPVRSSEDRTETHAPPKTKAQPPPVEPLSEPAVEILPGPKFNRQELESLASERISKVLGPIFARQDAFPRQVRMPMPPLLLADRVTGIDAEPGKVSTGTIWTETDILEDSWYLHNGRIPPGVMIEAGQADLLLISWMGADFENRGDRVYRLLGCELTYKAKLPEAGDTLCFDIHIDGHARQGPVRLFFFHYDCQVDGEVRLSVRNGQAGFFTDAELAESMGVLWSPETGEHREDVVLAPPAVGSVPRAFSRDAVQAFADGRAYECFGQGYERLLTHLRTPTIQGEKMCLMGEVQELDVTGGAWGRGYLRSELAITPEDWFFAGHFKNDPCMPGTLMFEGGMQAMAFYLAAMGFTLDRDGWRFEPVTDIPYLLRCRGQVTPSSKQLVYELFIEEVIDGPEPTLYADILATVDGLKAFHCRGMGLKLIPDFPLRALARAPKDHRFDELAMLHCAIGSPTQGMGESFARFDGPPRIARLPGPPYNFLSRTTHTDSPLGECKVGDQVELEYDIPGDAWYFDESGSGVMPFTILLEAGLQPCGWMCLYAGVMLETDADLYFRNLDGTGTVHRDIRPDEGTLKTRVTLKRLARSAGMVILNFDVDCRIEEESVFTMNTTFGFFPREALENQAGLPMTPQDLARLDEPGPGGFELSPRKEYFEGSLRLGTKRLLMLDRVTGFWPEGGRDGLGRLRAEKDVHPDQWFFKAHFFQDPVQPGSLGVEAMIQALQLFMLEAGHGARFDAPRFEAIATGEELEWKYRGQVRHHNQKVIVDVDVTAIEELTHQTTARADVSLWVDGMRIYEVKHLAMRIIDSKG